jgi:hypothetical protein
LGGGGKFRGGKLVVHDDFRSFMRVEVLPRKASNPGHIRLDGKRTGGNRDAAGFFRHHGRNWVVHADTHYAPLMIAHAASQAKTDPFVQEDTVRGVCLTLRPELRAKYKSPYKHLYIYSWAGA